VVSLRLRDADAFRVLVVQDFEGVTVEDGDDGSEKSAARERLAASKLPRTMARSVARNSAPLGDTAILLAGGEDGEAPVASITP